MSNVSLILVFGSLLIQLLAAIAAGWVAWVTRKAGWLLMASGFMLMSVRRVYVLSQALTPGGHVDWLNEGIALVIAFLLASGCVWFAYHKRRKTRLRERATPDVKTAEEFAAESRALSRWATAVGLVGVMGGLGIVAYATQSLAITGVERASVTLMTYTRYYASSADESSSTSRQEKLAAAVRAMHIAEPPIDNVSLEVIGRDGVIEMSTGDPGRVGKKLEPLERLAEADPRALIGDVFTARGSVRGVLTRDGDKEACVVTAVYSPDLDAAVSIVVPRISILRRLRSNAIGWLLGMILLIAFLPFYVILQQSAYWASQRRERAANAALILSESRFRAATDGSLDAFFILEALRDKDGKITDFVFTHLNQRGEALVEMPREKVLGQRLCDLFPINRAEGIVDKYIAVVDTGKTLEEEFPVKIPGVRASWLRHQVVKVGDGIAINTRDISDRKYEEERQHTLMRELDHRVRNNLAAVLSLAAEARERAQGVDDFHAGLSTRVHALARTHTALANQRWQGADLRDLARLVLEPYGTGSPGRIELRGPTALLTADAAGPVCMSLQELATNAAKYGSLSVPGGTLILDWSFDAAHNLTLTWTESNGPTVAPPKRKGMGTSLVEGLIGYQLNGNVEFDFNPQGLRCALTLPADTLLANPQTAPA